MDGVPEIREVKDYTLPEHFESWKAEIADKACQMAQERNIECKYIVAAMVLESGINPDAVGDYGCSRGVLQINECINPKNRDVEKQIALWLDNFSEVYAQSGSWQQAIVDWNSPKNAKYWWKTTYFKKYEAQLNQITAS